MNKKTKGLVAGIAGGALLLGAGGTFALWSDSAAIDGGAITAGTLEIEAKPLQWFDVSPDRVNPANDLADWYLSWDDLRPGLEDQPVVHGTTGLTTTTNFQSLDGPISGSIPSSPHDWRVVPGDFILGSSDVAISGHGDNLSYRFRLQSRDANGATRPIASGDHRLARALGFHVVVFDASRPHLELVAGPARLDISGDMTVDIDLGDVMTHGAQNPESRHFRVALVGNFPQDVKLQQLMSADGVDVTAMLDGLTLTVEQTRPQG